MQQFHGLLDDDKWYGKQQNKKDGECWGQVTAGVVECSEWTHWQSGI